MFCRKILADTLCVLFTSDDVLVDQQVYVAAQFTGGYDPKYATSILASFLIGYFSKKKYHEEGLFPHLRVDQFRQLPIRRINFTTPADERARLLDEAQRLADALIGDEGALTLAPSAAGWPRFDAAQFRATALGARLAALLPQDEHGSFIAFAAEASAAAEHSDVVHDLLAALAGAMIDLNGQKQAETRRFLGWLEATLDITADKDGRAGLDGLANKTTIQHYLGDYQKGEPPQPWASIHAVLHKNRKRFVNDGWLSPAQSPQLQREYEASLATLRPLKARLARTDALIDQIVYQLYGLTLADITIVEG